ncbi:MAG: ZIP family metal transporter [Holophagaceae bacterium]|nr:ZIP family metal transporter [Holophagaceae bacterium]
MSLAIQALLASLATLFGGWLVVRFLQGRAATMRLISGVAAGYLLSAALVRIIPESLEQGGEGTAYWVLGGFLLVHVMEHGITSHFHYGEETHMDGGPMTGIMALVGLSLHSFMDGLALAAAVHSSSNLGLFMFMALLLHRIPEGATISSIFLVRGFGRRGALLASAGLAVATLLGAMSQSALHLNPAPVLALAGGLVIYVASSDLLPQVQKERGWKSTLALLTGFGMFLITALIAPHQHGG